MRRLVLIFAFLLACPSFDLACSRVAHIPYRFDPQEFVFIGTVIGHSEPVEFDRYRREMADLPLLSSLKQGSGLVVAVTDKVFLPNQEPEFELFYYGLGSMCETIGIERSRLQKEFPIGTKLVVVAREASQVSAKSQNGLRRLETGPGLIAKYDSFFPNASSTSFYDFSRPYKDNDKWYYHYSQMVFEIRKELVRLHQASNNRERDEILKRLMKVRFGGLVDFYALLTLNTSSVKQVEKRLSKKLKKEGYKLADINSFLACRRVEGNKFYPYGCYGEIFRNR